MPWHFSVGTVRRAGRIPSRRLRPSRGGCFHPGRLRSRRSGTHRRGTRRVGQGLTMSRKAATTTNSGRSGAIWSRPGTEMRSSVSDMSSTATKRPVVLAATPMPTSRPFGTSTICCRQSRPTSASTGRRRLPISTSTDPRHIQVTTSSTSSDWTSTGTRRSPSTTTRGAVVSSRLCNRTSTSHRNRTSRCRTRNGAAPR